MSKFFAMNRARLVTVVIALLAAACSLFPDTPKVTTLGPLASPKIGIRTVWTHQLGGAVDFSLVPRVLGDNVFLANSQGTVLALEATSGRELWRVDTGRKINAGVGSDGKTVAVVDAENMVVAIQAGKVAWRQQLLAQAYTPPLVAGERIFVLTAERSVTALDAASGRKLWTQQHTADALVLKQAGVLLAVGDTLVVGQGSHLQGLNPSTGAVRWDVVVASSRGSNDVERLIDLVGPVSRSGTTVCLRAFQSGVACVDAARGQIAWSKKADGAVGLSGDARALYGSEADGKVEAWAVADGHGVWEADALKTHQLTAPLALGGTLLIGDAQGWLHVLSTSDGSVLNRVTLDSSGIYVPPVAVGNTVVVVTRQGSVVGLTPQR